MTARITITVRLARIVSGSAQPISAARLQAGNRGDSGDYKDDLRLRLKPNPNITISAHLTAHRFEAARLCTRIVTCDRAPYNWHRTTSQNQDATHLQGIYSTLDNPLTHTSKSDYQSSSLHLAATGSLWDGQEAEVIRGGAQKLGKCVVWNNNPSTGIGSLETE